MKVFNAMTDETKASGAGMPKPMKVIARIDAALAEGGDNHRREVTA